MPSPRRTHLRKLKDVMAQTSMAVLLLAFVASASTYTHKPEDLTYYTFSCPADVKWCGVDGGKWRGERILYYNYSIKDDIVIENVTEFYQKADCTGSLTSDGCNVTNITRNSNEEKVRKKVVTRGTEPFRIDNMPESYELGLLLTDNFNASGHLINDSYPLLQDKHWQISVPKGCRMKIYFRVFDLEASPQCNKDNFTVQTSKKQGDIHKYCHNLEEIEIRRRRRVQLTMHSDEDIARRGIYATVCISNMPEDTLVDQEPCTCQQKRVRRARRATLRDRSARAASSEVLPDSAVEYRNLLRMRIAEEDRQVAQWLRTLMEDGQSAIDRFIANPVNEKQRKLAIRYRAAVRLTEEERTSTH